MGRFKDGEIREYKEIINWLLKNDYEYVNNHLKAGTGYMYVYPIEDCRYYVWVTFNFEDKMILIYKEEDCCSDYWEDKISIKDDWLEDLDTFIEEVDQRLIEWIG